jgi:hypothetical protein
MFWRSSKFKTKSLGESTKKLVHCQDFQKKLFSQKNVSKSNINLRTFVFLYKTSLIYSNNKIQHEKSIVFIDSHFWLILGKL